MYVLYLSSEREGLESNAALRGSGMPSDSSELDSPDPPGRHASAVDLSIGQTTWLTLNKDDINRDIWIPSAVASARSSKRFFQRAGRERVALGRAGMFAALRSAANDMAASRQVRPLGLCPQ
ncbi:hypothetical protein VTN00DRAFT_5488 [Thermoascus crustaceus]|uniref:uncharacterized protein n=1 Tax=Thermoascus crustaceus TaxID=5088 RepID=UPI0037434640